MKRFLATLAAVSLSTTLAEEAPLMLSFADLKWTELPGLRLR